MCQCVSIRYPARDQLHETQQGKYYYIKLKQTLTYKVLTAQVVIKNVKRLKLYAFSEQNHANFIFTANITLSPSHTTH